MTAGADIEAGTKRRAGARDRILAAAGKLFYRDGVGATGVNALVDEAGTAKASFYQHFASKDDLVVAWLASWDQRCCARVDPVRSRRAGEGFRALSIFDALEERVGGVEWRGCAFINSASELADPAHPAHPVIARHKARLREQLADAIRADGVADARCVAEELHLLFEGAVVAASAQDAAAPVSVARNAAARLLLAARAEDASADDRA